MEIKHGGTMEIHMSYALTYTLNGKKHPESVLSAIERMPDTQRLSHESRETDYPVNRHSEDVFLVNHAHILRVVLYPEKKEQWRDNVCTLTAHYDITIKPHVHGQQHTDDVFNLDSRLRQAMADIGAVKKRNVDD